MAGGMGGGWGKRGSGVPLAERSRAMRADIQPDPPAEDSPCPGRHCWVADAADGRGVKRPGLLVEWREVEGREAEGRWQGRVVYVALLRPGAWALVEEWLPAELLTPS